LGLAAEKDKPLLREAIAAAGASLEGYLQLESRVDIVKTRELINDLESLQ
jgi:hypothetical protein